MSKSLALEDVTTAGCCAPLSGPQLSEQEAAELAKVFKALADPVRLRLLNLIASQEGGEACVCDLTGPFDLTAPTISHHLKVLRQAGLITGERRGTWVYYRVIPEALTRLSGLFALSAFVDA
ncbi:ArsR/SmtB family transcription factor [Thermomonospora cellulosilytica]|uniref:ArsR family transcriptional regulator n=1 Tax=Thermomonospora cellulosilytica TaxID=1411118 RepID=A0A7W3R9D8_9ACTN|nr:metalloregulator ArsR/SmtB family transcription factor [Thermomonospora cellulosilytica]MBA9005233.1 ArsR family transcriptional regulator [Thermomonospora cellulosilytica]